MDIEIKEAVDGFRALGALSSSIQGWFCESWGSFWVVMLKTYTMAFELVPVMEASVDFTVVLKQLFLYWEQSGVVVLSPCVQMIWVEGRRN